MPTRQEMWDRLGKPVDVLVVGGGVTGAGIARDAARRGLSTAVVEMRDLAWGTSSRSSKLVHGGLRYLEHYEFSLVFEAVSERRILLDIAPHLVNPLGFLFPVYKGSRQKLWLVNAGMWVYEGLSLFRSPKRHKSLDPAGVAKEEPLLVQDGLTGAPLYYDCSTNDARITLESALDAADNGATIATWAKVVSFLKDDETGRVRGVVVQDHFTDELREVHAEVVINATGPWTDRTVSMSKPPRHGGLLRPTKGVHIVVPRDKLLVNNAVVCFHPEDGRVLFAIPWEDATYIGTTDTDFDGDPAEVHADGSDVDYLIDAANAYFPSSPITRDDVIATWAGLRPLMRPEPVEGEEVDESAVSREHQIVVGRDGLITIAGGKLTTFRLMAAEVVDTAVKLLRLTNKLPEVIRSCDTDREPLPGAVGWPEDDDHHRVSAKVLEAGGGAIEQDTAWLLTNMYGMRALKIAKMAKNDPKLAQRLLPDRPEILAMVDWSVHQELTATPSDFFIRRTRLYYRHRDQGLDALPTVADRMGELLGWSKETRAQMVEAYRHDVGLSRAWKQD